MKLNKRKCKNCKVEFQKLSPLHSLCSQKCAIENANKLKLKREALEAKKQRKEYKDTKEKLKTRPDHLREAQRWFNAWVRQRDLGFPCIACNKPMNKKINASHYKSVGAHPELRFEPLNCHAGCEACNTYLSGNILNYRINLINRIGLEKVEWLESQHEAKHYSVDDIRAIKGEYKRKLKELKDKHGEL